MTAHKLHLAALGARTRRLARRHHAPVERALALVIIARAFADHAASEAAAHPRREHPELVGAEQVLTAALKHLHRVRQATYHHQLPDSTARSDG